MHGSTEIDGIASIGRPGNAEAVVRLSGPGSGHVGTAIVVHTYGRS